MSMGAELAQYILQTQLKKILKIHWGGMNSPSGYADGLT